MESTSQTDIFTLPRAFSIILSVLLIGMDYILDILLAIEYHENGYKYLFCITLTLMVFSSLLMTAFSLHSYFTDFQKNKIAPVSRMRWVVRLLLHVFQLAPLIRCIEAVRLGYESRKDARNYKKLVKQYDREHCYAATMKLLQSFTEGCPQILIQMYIVAQHHRAQILQQQHIAFPGTLTWMKIFISLLSFSWALTYNRVKKMKGWNMRAIQGLGNLVQMCWYTFTLLSRFLSLTLFAISSHTGFTIVLCLHWFLMTMWLYLMQTKKFEQMILNIFYDMCMAIAYIFHYVKVEDVPTRRHYLIYYNVIFLEGAIMISYWFNQTREYIKSHPFLEGTPAAYIPVILFCVYLMGFAIGLSCMFVYYKYLHPSKEFIKAHRWHILSIRSKHEAANDYNDTTSLNTEDGHFTDENTQSHDRLGQGSEQLPESAETFI